MRSKRERKQRGKNARRLCGVSRRLSAASSSPSLRALPSHRCISAPACNSRSPSCPCAAAIATSRALTTNVWRVTAAAPRQRHNTGAAGPARSHAFHPSHFCTRRVRAPKTLPACTRMLSPPALYTLVVSLARPLISLRALAALSLMFTQKLRLQHCQCEDPHCSLSFSLLCAALDLSAGQPNPHRTRQTDLHTFWQSFWRPKDSTSRRQCQTRWRHFGRTRSKICARVGFS